MRLSFILFAFVIAIASCKKGDVGPAGEQGPAGPQGPQGPQGIAGNANAMQYTYGTANFTSGFVTLHLSTSLDTMNRSTWLVYLFYEPISRWYFTPGYGNAGTTFYRISMAYLNSKVNLFIDKSGPGEIYSSVKVVRIYNSGSMTGGRPGEGEDALPDYSDYEAVKRYYKLED